jgi:hypothetical protein
VTKQIRRQMTLPQNDPTPLPSDYYNRGMRAARGMAAAEGRNLDARLSAVEKSTHSAELDASLARRDRFFEACLESGQISHDDVPVFARAYTKSPEATEALLSGRRPNQSVADANRAASTFAGDGDRQYGDDAATRLGLNADEVV